MFLFLILQIILIRLRRLHLILLREFSVLKKYYSSLANSRTIPDKIDNSESNMAPGFATGLIDAEGSFTVSVLKSLYTKTGWVVNARFKITVHIVDLDLILNLQKYFKGVGKIVIFKETCTYRVDKLKDILEVIIPHFDKYPLVTQKLADYILFKKIVNLMVNKEHLTLEGLKTMLSFKSSLNLGLSEELKLNLQVSKQQKDP